MLVEMCGITVYGNWNEGYLGHPTLLGYILRKGRRRMSTKKIAAIIKNAEKVAILPHVSVDGDGLGSSLALALALTAMGKKAQVFLEENVPYTFSFLPGMHLLNIFEDSLNNSDFRENGGCDLVIALDTGDMERLGKRALIFGRTENTVNIDHHQTNTGFAACNYVGTEFSAVGEMIYLLLNELGVTMDTAMATCLYVAISTDTGGFRYSNTTSLTHRITAELLNAGVEVADISQKVFDTMSMAKTKLMGKAIDSLEFFENGKISVITLTDAMMKETGAGDADCDGIVNIGRNVCGVEATAMLRQKGADEIRVNLRSNTYVDVSRVAQAFAGGGHKKAAGCTIRGSIQTVKQKIVQELQKQLREE